MIMYIEFVIVTSLIFWFGSAVLKVVTNQMNDSGCKEITITITRTSICVVVGIILVGLFKHDAVSLINM